MIDCMTESDWKRLLRQIQQGLVVPVVGSRLLCSEAGDWLPELVAQRLLGMHGLQAEGLPQPSFMPLDRAVKRLRVEAQVKLPNLYADASDAIDSVVAEHAAQMPLALQQLAAISDFRLLVTTTPDDLLARCLRQRGALDEIVHAPKWPTDEWHDLADDWSQRSGTTHLATCLARPAPARCLRCTRRTCWSTPTTSSPGAARRRSVSWRPCNSAAC